MQKKNLILIKLGGSLITNKKVENTLHKNTLNRVLDEITEAHTVVTDHFLLGNGQGSFAHFPAKKYNTKSGFISSESTFGMAVTHHSAGRLTRIIIDHLLERKIPAIRYHLSNTLTSKNDVADPQKLSVLCAYLDAGLIPVTCGDVLADSVKGCTIWSTEKIFNYIISCMALSDYQVKTVIHVTDVDGVLDKHKQVIPNISLQDSDVLSLVSGADGTDVTGGMIHKVTESLQLLATHGITSIILSGKIKENLLHCVTGQEFIGTTISQ